MTTSPLLLLRSGAALFAVAVLLGVVATSDAKAPRTPTPTLVTSRLHDAMLDAVERDRPRLYAAATDWHTGCRTGTRGDETRLVRYWCVTRLFEGERVVWSARWRARLKRSDTRQHTTVRCVDNASCGAGIVQIKHGWYATTQPIT